MTTEHTLQVINITLAHYDPSYNYDDKQNNLNLIVDSYDKKVIKHQFFTIFFLVENRNLDLTNVLYSHIHIIYNITDFSWLPKNLQSLKISNEDFNSTISGLDQLYYLSIFSNKFSSPIILFNLRSLCFKGIEYDLPIEELFIMKYLKKLTIVSNVFKHSIEHLDQLNLSDLKIDVYQFNQPVNHLTSLLKLIIASDNFNQPIYNLTKLVTLLIQSPHFNQPVNDLIELRALNIYNSLHFNQPVNRLTNLQDMVIESVKFDQPIDQIRSHCKIILI